jgi:hypothetical protein
MNEPLNLSPDAEARITELEWQLARAKRELEIYRADAANSLRDSDDWKPLTPEEEANLMSAPQGHSLRSIIAEFEQMGES